MANHTFYRFSEIAGMCGGRIILQAGDPSISSLDYDSRTLTRAGDSLFFALKSKNRDGHRFLHECFLKGVRSFVISDPKALEAFHEDEKASLNIILAADTLLALQQLAAVHRARFSYPVIGITGSNGKTVIKEWLYELLRDSFHIVRSPKSFNSQLGVPLSLWQLGQEHDLAIIEAGISQAGEMPVLEEMIRPDIGIFTNIGEAHQAHFHSYEQKAEEKIQLFRHCGCLIYSKAYPILQDLIDYKFQTGFFEHPDIKLLGWNWGPAGELSISMEDAGKGVLLRTCYQEQEHHIRVPFRDKASLENIVHASITALYLNAADKAEHNISRLSPLAMRMEIKQGIHGCTVINDSYSADLQSLRIALDTLAQQNQHPRKTAILSDILQSGRPEKQLYAAVAAMLQEKGVSRIIGIGPALCRQIGSFTGRENYFYPSTAAFLREHDFSSFNNEAILLKGSRPFGFEEIAAHLQQKTHQTVLETNLNALVHNLNVYRRMLRPGTGIMAMVKAFSYGSGSYEIANVLQFHGVDYLAVAYADEGIALRQNGITLPILVMNPEADAVRSMLEYGLEPEVYSLRILDQFINALPSDAGAETLSVHIKAETGMNRLGLELNTLPDLLEKLQHEPRIRVKSVFSHLASADVPEHDDFTEDQFRRFTLFADELETGAGYHIFRHLLNSSGITRFPHAHLDMVRLGIGLYGIDPTAEVQAQLEEVSTLKTHISQIKTLEPGDTVGYSRKGTVSRPSRIATLGIGYADGIPRRLGNGQGHIWLHGQEAPLIGNICMDMCMADVTDIPDAREGDEVILFGPLRSVRLLAEEMETIPYEVLTGISQRVKRVYLMG